MKTKTLLQEGLPLVMNRELLKVTTIKKKHADQIRKMEWKDFVEGMKSKEIQFVGRIEDSRLIITRDGHYNFVGYSTFVEWWALQQSDEDRKLWKDAKIDIYGLAADRFMAIPQLFKD